MEALLTVRQFADLMQVSPAAVKRWVRDRRVPVVRPTKRTIRIPADDALAQLKQGSAGPSPDGVAVSEGGAANAR